MGWQESFINVAHISLRDLELFGLRLSELRLLSKDAKG